jgi:hypothetical protein
MAANPIVPEELKSLFPDDIRLKTLFNKDFVTQVCLCDLCMFFYTDYENKDFWVIHELK